jgi:hypothetical protein
MIPSASRLPLNGTVLAVDTDETTLGSLTVMDMTVGALTDEGLVGDKD